MVKKSRRPFFLSRQLIGILMISIVFFALTDPARAGDYDANRVEGATFTVNSTADARDASPGDGLCASTAGECTLRAAVMETNALVGGDRIILLAGTYTLTIVGGGEDSAYLGDLDIRDKLQIIGDATETTIIDGNGTITLDRAFHIVEGTSRLQNMTITGGEANGGGGVSNSSTLHLENVAVMSNRARRDGGGIFNETNGTLLLINSTVSENEASVSDWFRGGGGIYIDSGSRASIQNSRIISNTVPNGAEGGGLYVNGTARISDSLIAWNFASHEAGAIMVDSGDLSVIRSTLSNNTAITSGGAIRMFGGRLSLQDSTITGNSAGGSGGFLFNNGDTYITNSTISGNTAQWGGAVQADIWYDLHITNSTLTNNSATESGGGIYIDYISESKVVLANSIMAGNTAPVSPECYHHVKSAGYNVIGNQDGCGLVAAPGDQVGTADDPIDPLLGPLTGNGGPTLTHALLPGSPALDRGNPAGCSDHNGNIITADQRGRPRPVDGDANGTVICDIGAYEHGRSDFSLAVAPATYDLCAGSDAIYAITIDSILGYAGEVTLSASGHPAGTTATFSLNPVTIPGTSDLTIGDTGQGAAGRYTITIAGSTTNRHHTATVGLNLSAATPGQVALISPPNGATGVSRTPTLNWTATGPADTYSLQVAADAGFNDLVYTTSTSEAAHQVTSALDANTTYYWRVRAQNGCGLGVVSAAFTFQTSDLSNYFEVDSFLDAVDADPGDGLCASAADECTLRAAIQEANALAGDHSIVLPSGVFTLTIAGAGEDIAASGDLDIASNLSILGAGEGQTIIEGNEAVIGDRLLHVLNGVAATVTDLTLSGGGKEYEEGNTILNDGELTLIQVTAADSADTYYNYGIHNNGAINFQDSTISGHYGNAINNASSGRMSLKNSIVVNNGSGLKNNGILTIDQSTINGNSGSGITNYEVVTITNSAIISQTLIDDPSSSDEGGGIYNNQGEVTVIGSTIAGNSSEENGGGIWSINGEVTIKDSFIAGNSAPSGGGLYLWSTPGVISNTILMGNVAASGKGGGIFTRWASVTITGSAVINNAAAYGAGIYNEASDPSNDILNLTNSTVSGNSSTIDGGGIYNAENYSNTPQMYLHNATISRNTATGNGGGLYQVSTTVTGIRNSVIADNSASTGPNCSGPLTSNGHNLIGDVTGCNFATSVGDQVGTAEDPIDPLLGPLQDNGGPTLTHALLAGSPAIDVGNPAGCTDQDGNLLLTDQRSYDRHVDGDSNGSAICDIGAYELEAAVPLYCSSPNLAIPDNTPAGVSDSLTIADPGALTDLNLYLLADHTFVGDLVFDLEHVETGTSARLIERPGGPPAPYCDGNDIDATLDDEAAGPVEDACAPSEPTISGSFTPNNPLAAFDGQTLSGTWQLTARDVAANDIGTLIQWCVAPATTTR